MSKLAHIITFMIGSLSLVGPVAGQQQNVRIEAKFDPVAITLSRATNYKVTIHGSQQSSAVNLPQVDGLAISNSPRIFRSASFINGIRSIRLERSYSVTPNRVGTFTLPAWPISIGGRSLTVPATTLRVLPPSQEDILREEARQKQQADFRQALFLELSLPRDYFFVGQTALGTVNLFIWDRLPVTRLEHLPKKLGVAFSQSEMKQPLEKRNVPRNGKTYVVYSWPLALTAVMEGNHDLQYSLGVRVRVRSQSNPAFRDPFLIDPFFGFGSEESIAVTSEKKTFEIRQLPMDGRPASFLGAIGSFDTKTSKDASRVTVGDPVRVTFSISGKGNFGVMPAPEMTSMQNLKIGPPAFSFEGDENLKYEGIQKFEYVVTPLRPALIEIPPVPFSYFDPTSQSYVVASTETLSLRVDPGETWVDPTPVEPTATETQSTEPSRMLFQTESDPGEWHDSLTPAAATRSSFFWYVQIAPLMGFVMLLGWQFRQNRSTKDSLSKRLGKLRQEMKVAARQKDVPGFLRATRGIIREEVGSLVKHGRPEALALDEVLTILRQREVSEETIANVQELLETADANEFAGAQESNIQLKEWRSRVKFLLKRIRSEA